MPPVRKPDLVAPARSLSRDVDKLPPLEEGLYCYNPLEYAWDSHLQYLTRYGQGRKRVLFLGMNPGPFGMAQTGVPFGEVCAVRDWLGIETAVAKPSNEHSARPIEGFNCQRSEVSGRRLWGLFQTQFETAEAFFRDHFVANYCPLLFFRVGTTARGRASCRNVTPEELPSEITSLIYPACDRALAQMVKALDPDWLIGVGKFAATCLGRLPLREGQQVADILHPSPASPSANRDFEGLARKRLEELGIW